MAINALSSGGNSMLAVYNLSSPTVFSAPAPRDRANYQQCGGNAIWFKIEDDNTNLKFYVSADGLEFVLWKSMARGSFMTGGPDEVFWGGNNANNGDNEALVRLVHWSRSS